MKYQQTPQSERSTGQSKKGNVRNRLAVAFGLGTIFTGIALIWLMLSPNASSSRPSTPAEIAAQEVFQEKLISSQVEFHQKINTSTEQKLDKLGK